MTSMCRLRSRPMPGCTRVRGTIGAATDVHSQTGTFSPIRSFALLRVSRVNPFSPGAVRASGCRTGPVESISRSSSDSRLATDTFSRSTSARPTAGNGGNRLVRPLYRLSLLSLPSKCGDNRNKRDKRYKRNEVWASGYKSESDVARIMVKNCHFPPFFSLPILGGGQPGPRAENRE
jgi:hypothetical protein